MHRSAIRKSFYLKIFQSSSKQSLQFLPCIPNPYSSLPKPYFSPIETSNPHLLRSFCSNQPIDYGKEVDEINFKFAEAREEIDAALESKETVYFDEEAECARDAVKSVFDMFEGLLARVPEKDRSALQRSMGLKMEQLKAELKQLDD